MKNGTRKADPVQGLLGVFPEAALFGVELGDLFDVTEQQNGGGDDHAKQDVGADHFHSRLSRNPGVCAAPGGRAGGSGTSSEENGEIMAL